MANPITIQVPLTSRIKKGIDLLREQGFEGNDSKILQNLIEQSDNISLENHKLRNKLMPIKGQVYGLLANMRNDLEEYSFKNSRIEPTS